MDSSKLSTWDLITWVMCYFQVSLSDKKVKAYLSLCMTCMHLAPGLCIIMNAVHKQTIRINDGLQHCSQKENFRVICTFFYSFPLTIATFEHEQHSRPVPRGWPCCLKAFNKALNPRLAQAPRLDILNVTHSSPSFSSFFSSDWKHLLWVLEHNAPGVVPTGGLC